MSKDETQVVEIDESLVKAVSDKATKSVDAKIADAVKGLSMPTADEIAEKLAERTEKTSKADIHETKEKRHLKTGIEAMPKEVRFAKAIVAMKNKDMSTLREYNQNAAKMWLDISKSDYQNVTTSADGGALVPDPEFIAEIERLTDEYGVAARLADVRRTDRDSVTLLKGTNEINFTKVGEMTAANAQKLTYDSSTVTLDKYITTLVMSSEIVEDSAIDMFADATSEVGRARAKLFDQLVFTDATHGLLSATAGDEYKTRTIGAGIANLDFDDLLPVQYDVVSSARRNGRFFMHPTVWNQLRSTRIDNGGGAGTGVYIAGDPTGTVTPTIDGIPVELVDIMPAIGDITSNESFIAFGDLSRIKIHVKRLLETKVFDSGVVPDAGGTDINLISQDAWAMRATLRAVPQTRFEGAFAILGTGTVS